MKHETVIRDFAAMGRRITDYLRRSDRCPPLAVAVQKSIAANSWFTEATVRTMLTAIADDMLDAPKLARWLLPYPVATTPKQTGVVMAGNIPLAGFHDFLCVLASGNLFTGKLSHKDPFLLPALAGLLTEINPEWRRRITFVDALSLDALHALIATGSDATARHFETLVASLARAHSPTMRTLIRHNRRSAALLTGHETPAQWQALTDDILAYFGFGCRNVSLLYIPEGYDLQPLTAALAARADVRRHAGYDHLYRYRKAILTIDRQSFVDAESVVLCEDPTLHAPPAVVHYSYYRRPNDALEMIGRQSEQLQCVVAGRLVTNKFCTFGMAQRPALHDYADGTDTMRWLNEKNTVN
ncbi:MAG: aldehyde dehydrogenase [Prevotellaceae bacterium]|jgi:hypothetical protein|nr:aldehyde dehydrogenase [Prevotellaceae bacterium]